MVDFSQQMTGLLNSPLLNLGVGLLAAGGPSAQPVGFGQGLQQALGFAQERQQGLLRNELLRQGLRDRQAQQQARTQLTQAAGGLLGATDPQQRQALGLLAAAAPQAFAQGLLGQMFQQPRAEPADIRTMRLLGLPLTPEGFAELQGLKGDDDTLLRRIQAAQAGLQTQIAEENLRSKRREREEAEKTAARTRLDGQTAVRRGIGNVIELTGLVDRLEGTFLETGGGGDQLRREGLGFVSFIGDRLGFDTQTQQRVANDYDRFVQLATGSALENLEVLRGTGAISDRKFQTLLKTFTDTTASPGAIRLALADALEAQLDAASRFEVDLSDQERADLETLVGTLRRGGAARTPAALPADDGIVDFNSLPGGG